MGWTVTFEAAGDQPADLEEGLDEFADLLVAEFDRDLETPNLPELVGVSEIAELLGVTRQRASALVKAPDFPTPVTTLAAGPVWTRLSLNRFVEEWRKEGRPRRSP